MGYIVIKITKHNYLCYTIGIKQYSSSNRPPGISGDRLDKLSNFNFSDHQKFLASFRKDEKFFKEKWINDDFGSPKLNNLRDQVTGVWKTQEKIENFLDSAQGTAGRPESSQKRHREAIEKYNEKIEALEKKRDQNWMELEEEFKGEKCIAYMEKALAISSSSHKKIVQEKIKQLELLNNDLKTDLKLKEIMPENSQALDPIFNLIDKKDPTLQDYIDKRKSLLNDEIHKSRSQKKEVMENLTADLESPMDLAVGIMEESGPEIGGGDD
jgi:predicted DNA-binding protein YlxM (UPF0122 family)